MSDLKTRLEEATASTVKGSVSIGWFIDSAFCLVKSKLIGRVLTIIDASIADQEQRKALKDLVKEAFSSTLFLESSIAQYARESAACTFEGESNMSCSSELSNIMPIHTEGYEYTCKEL